MCVCSAETIENIKVSWNLVFILSPVSRKIIYRNTMKFLSAGISNSNCLKISFAICNPYYYYKNLQAKANYLEAIKNNDSYRLIIYD